MIILKRRLYDMILQPLIVVVIVAIARNDALPEILHH